MAERKRIIKFAVDKQTKRLKSLCESNTVFALYAPKRIKLKAGQFVIVQTNVKIDLPDNIKGIYVIFHHGQIIKLTRYTTIQKTQLELFNGNQDKTITNQS